MAEGWVHEFILGGQKSGKSRRAELQARDWLAQSPAHRACLIATAQPWDDEMRERILRHQQARQARVPGLQTVEEPLALAEAIGLHSRPDTLLVVDCLTLWLTNHLMPADEVRTAPLADPAVDELLATLTTAIQAATGPVLLVGNEIGLGVIPMGAQVRAFVDRLGVLNQRVANACGRVTLMVAGQALVVKGGAA